MKQTLSVKTLVRLALLTALALIMFVLEAQIPNPIPLPGFKLGLSNIVTVFILFWDGPVAALLVLLIRVVLGSVITGQLNALVFSLSGGLFSLLCMVLLRRFLLQKQLWVASVIGGLAHNAGQVVAAVLVTGTPSLFYYFPLLAAVGMATGLFTGLCATFVLRRLKHAKGRSAESPGNSHE